MTTFRKMSKRFLIRHRKLLVVAIHLFFIPTSNYLAFLLRFDGAIPTRFFDLMVGMFPWLFLVRTSIFIVFRLYQGLWRYTGIWDLWNIIISTLLGSLLFYIIVRVGHGISFYPRSVFVMDAILLIFFLGGVRLLWRFQREMNRTFHSSKGKRVLIYGAGDAGEMIARDMKHHPDYRYEPVGFIDDDPSKIGQRIHGISVLGTRSSLAHIIPKQKIDQVVVAIPSAPASTLREILKDLELFSIPIKTLPNLKDILDQRISISQIRNLSVEDLMTRVPVNMDLSSVPRMLAGRRVLVTGAGGSIGAELCRQIAKLNPMELVLFERYENGLFEITNELSANGHAGIIHPVIGDITDKKLVQNVFQHHRPEVVFHAAAHKHVPLMESNPCEAVKNNVTGTRILAREASKIGVGKFVLISTDKAVNPTSVMGASKRIAEMVVSFFSKKNDASFVTVRFGNVLASNGSVVPLFLDQIKRRAPVTVTHADMRRYFMLIPEAVQLVLLSAATSGNAETYVLEMGEQISVLEMARNLIRLSGFVPDLEIPIVFTGLRPGEKLFEELIAEDEIAEPSHMPDILKIRQKHEFDPRAFRQKIFDLEQAASKGDRDAVVDCLINLVPTFRPAKEMSLAIDLPETEPVQN